MSENRKEGMVILKLPKNGKKEVKKEKGQKGSMKDEKGGPPIVYTDDIHPMPQAKILISFLIFSPEITEEVFEKTRNCLYSFLGKDMDTGKDLIFL